MRGLNLTTKLAILVGCLTTIMTCLAVVFTFFMIFLFAEKEIKNNLETDYKEVLSLASPERSFELATYLRGKDLSLLIQNENDNVIAKYGIYRNLSTEELQKLMKLNDGYVDISLPGYGYYDTYTKSNIQIAGKNNITPLFLKSGIIVMILFLPIVWLFSVISGVFGSKLVMSSYVAKQIKIIEHISHEIKTPLTHATLAIQDLGNRKLKLVYEELLKLGKDVDSILSLSLLNKFSIRDHEKSDLNKEIGYYLKRMPAVTKVNVSIREGLLLPIPSPYLRIILKNLLENAAKNSQPDGVISIVGKKTGNGWLLSVKNKSKPEVKRMGFAIGLIIVRDVCKRFNLRFFTLNRRGYYQAVVMGKTIA